MSLKIKAKILSGLFSIICALGYFAPNTIKAVEHPTVDPTEKPQQAQTTPKKVYLTPQ